MENQNVEQRILQLELHVESLQRQLNALHKPKRRIWPLAILLFLGFGFFLATMELPVITSKIQSQFKSIGALINSGQ